MAKSPRKKKIKNKIVFGKNYSFFHTKKTNLSTGKYFKSGKKCYKNKLKRILFEFWDQSVSMAFCSMTKTIDQPLH